MSRAERADTAVLAALALLTSVAAYLFFRHHGTVLGYKDSVSHLLIGRRIVVGEQTGFGQLGGIWLPLQHVLIMTLAWNDTLFESGLAGSVFSMAAYVGTVLGLYAVVRVATGRRWPGWVAAGVYGLSADALYLQATPMGETLMYLGIVVAVLAVLLWYRTDRHRWLFLGAVTCLLLVLVRYEAWVFSATLWLVVLHVCVVKRHRFLTGDLAGQAYALVFGAFMGLGVLGWLAWDLVIFGDALEWLRGAHGSIDQTSGLDLSQVGDLRLSLLTYAYGVRGTAGTAVALVGVAGLVLMAWRERLSPVFTAFLATAAPGAFLIYGLYSGGQPMRVEEVDGDLYNLRMAVVMLLPISLFAGYAVSLVPRLPGPAGRRAAGVLRAAVGALALVVAGAGLASAETSGGHSVLTSREAGESYDAYAEQRTVGAFVERHTTGTVLVESIYNEWVVFPNQRRVVYEGTGTRWADALDDPAGAGIDVVVMRTTPGDTDTVAQHLGSGAALAAYGVVLQTDNFLVWQRGVELDERGRR